MASSEVFLILYHDASIGLDEAAKALGVERNGDVIHVRANRGPDLRIRAACAVSARDGRLRWDRNLPDAVAAFPRAFEVSLDDLDNRLEEIHALAAVQITLEDLTGGACYNIWNDRLIMPGSSEA